MRTVRVFIAALWALGPLTSACCHSSPASTGRSAEPERPPADARNAGRTAVDRSDSIGAATMKDDGTIVLQLSVVGIPGVIGDGYVEYPRGHQHYQYVLDHLGGLQPGQEKPVRPFPPGPDSKAEPPTAAELARRPIGVVAMAADRSLEVELWTDGPEVVRKTFRRDHPKYQAIVDDVGPIKPGEEKIVLAGWPGQDESSKP